MKGKSNETAKLHGIEFLTISQITVVDKCDIIKKLIRMYLLKLKSYVRFLNALFSM